jgi:acetate kinase
MTTPPNTYRILTINSGSSSVKISLYEMGEAENLVLSGSMKRIGLRAGLFQIKDTSGKLLIDDHTDLPDHETALKKLFAWLEGHEPGQSLDAVGHRVVHGGPKHNKPQRITPALVTELKELVQLAPDHLPHEIKAIQATTRSYPDLTQVACFDTAFHRHMPDLAQIYALPRHYHHEGLVRYGFHGLSYEYILQELRKEGGEEVVNGRVIIAHLGNGASMAAVRYGKSLDTTMGFTPAGGLVMSTRSGDLDPGVVIYLMEEKGMHASALNELVNQHAGLLGVSGISSDMKDLLDKEEEEVHARQAVDLFCYQASKHLGALAAVLGGLDTLVFTAGIGENSPAVRQRICQNLSFLGIHLDEQRNAANEAIISREDGPVVVRVMRTDEDLMIARHTYSLIRVKQNIPIRE